MSKQKLGKALVNLTKRVTKPFTATSVKTRWTLEKTGAPMENKINSSGQKYASGRSKQVTRITDAKKRAERAGTQTSTAKPGAAKKKGSALKTTAKVAGVIIGTAAGATGSAEYLKKKNAEAKANANKVKVNANKVQQNVSKVNANTLKNYKNEEKVAENTRKVAANKSKVQDNAVKVYSNAEKVNAEKARTATTNAQKVAANKAKIEANKKKVAANAAKYK